MIEDLRVLSSEVVYRRGITDRYNFASDLMAGLSAAGVYSEVIFTGSCLPRKMLLTWVISGDLLPQKQTL